MGIYEFNILPLEDRYSMTYNEGQFVDTVTEGSIKYVLYSLFYFWVEIQYDSLNNKTIDIASFVAGDSLNRYSNVSKQI